MALTLVRLPARRRLPAAVPGRQGLPGRLLAVVLTALATAVLACGTSAAAPPAADSAAVPYARSVAASETGLPDTAGAATGEPAVCERCAHGEDGDRCDGRGHHAVRGPSAHPAPCAEAGCRPAYVPDPGAPPSGTPPLTAATPRPPDLHLLQLLRV